MAKLGEEREHNLSELNQKRVQHVTTLQQMGKQGFEISKEFKIFLVRFTDSFSIQNSTLK